MKSKSYYESQYQLQKQSWENSRREKVNNLLKDLNATETKIFKLTSHLNELQKAKEEIEKKEFPSFEEFFSRIQEQSKKAKQKEA